MHEGYDDIRSRIAEHPLWHDANGVPRYDPFHPHLCPSIYSNEVVLLRIQCQACHEPFDVEMHAGFFHSLGNPKKLHYGDPPRHACPGAGETMNCEDLAVLQVWTRAGVENFQRRPEFEGLIDPGPNEAEP